MAKLSKENIREIIAEHQKGVPTAHIAEQFHVDRSTISYHIEKLESAFVLDGNVYSLIKAETQHQCIHPSMKCSVCGVFHDTILREERQLISDLRVKLRVLNGGEEDPRV